MSPLILGAAIVMLVSCGGDPAGTVEPIEEAESLPLQIAFQGLCDARTLAEAGDIQAASDTFQSRAHAELHSLADRLAASDRDAAARLLEAKQRVEAAFASPESAAPPVVAAQLSTLEAEVASAAHVLGQERPVCGGVGV